MGFEKQAATCNKPRGLQQASWFAGSGPYLAYWSTRDFAPQMAGRGWWRWWWSQRHQAVSCHGEALLQPERPRDGACPYSRVTLVNEPQPSIHFAQGLGGMMVLLMRRGSANDGVPLPPQHHQPSRLHQTNQFQPGNSHQKQTESVFGPSIPFQFRPVLTHSQHLKSIDLSRPRGLVSAL